MYTDKERTHEIRNYGHDCVQRAGDMLYVPRQWAHMVINIGDTLAVVSEQGADIQDASIPLDEELSISFVSPYRVDVYYDDPDDDDEYGSLISTLEKNEQYGINSYVGHTFFVTPHGMKHRLFVNGERLSFNVGQRDQEFRVPRDAYSEDWSEDDENEEDSEDHTIYSEKKEWATTRAAQLVDRFWRHIQEEQAGLDDGDGEHFQDVQQCIQNLLSKDDMRRLEEQTTPLIVDTLEDTENRTILVEIANAISPEQAEAIKVLAACSQEFFPDTRLEHRDFGSGGGNDCTFVNTLLQLFLPQVYKNVVRIAEVGYEEAGWGEKLKLKPPGKCGLRTSEYLNYGQFKGLGGHEDQGSLFTVLFALSDPKGYRGGEYYIVPRDDHAYYFKPRQYSAILFLSETHHGVTDINVESGTREMFTNEFWLFDDPPWKGSHRPHETRMGMFENLVDEELNPPEDYFQREDVERLWNYSRQYESDDSDDEDEDSIEESDCMESKGDES